MVVSLTVTSFTEAAYFVDVRRLTSLLMSLSDGGAVVKVGGTNGISFVVDIVLIWWRA